MKKHLLCLLFGCLTPCLKLMAQMNGTFGNEWIQFSQKYIKIKVAKEGIYVVNYNNLIAAGLSSQEIASINPANIQLFYRGTELPIYVSAQGLAQFGSSDFIEFFGQKNDGKLDKPLFKKPEWQPQDYKSFYNDTAVYFLTWSATNAGKRLLPYFQNNYGSYTPLPYFLQREANTFSTYYDGLNYTSDLKYHQQSDFTEGEGYISAFIWNKGSLNVSNNFFDIYPGAGGLKFHTEVFGVREPVYKSVNGISHHVFAKLVKNVGKINTTLDSVEKSFKEYENPDYDLVIPDTKLDTGIMKITTSLGFINDLSITYDITYVQKLEYEYPRRFRFRGASAMSMLIPASGQTDEYISIKEFGNGTKLNAYIYDFENGIRAKGTSGGNNLDVMLKGFGKDRKIYVADSTDRLSPISLNMINFSPVDTNRGTDYLIVSHKQFAKSTALYASFRDSSFKTATAWIDELYDQFCYGYNSPLAIRNYCNFLLQRNVVKPKFLLLIGKGIQTDFAKALSNINFVPTWGVPGTDNLITAGLDGSRFEPAIPTGRIPAVVDSQVLIYLTKLKIYEKDINTPALWKKSILHTGGGIDQFQTEDLKSQLKSLQSIAESDSFGARLAEYYKFQSVPVSGSLTEQIREELRNGKSMTFYFGHGASDRMELDMGDPQEATNLNKLPIMHSAGCLLGNSYFANNPQMGEKWLFAHKERGNAIDAYGAIGWIGNTWYGYLYQLGDYYRNYYHNAFYKNYGKSIGEILKNTVIDNTDTNSYLVESHCKQVVILGDPAIKLYSPKYPDYLLANKFTAVGIPASLSIFPENTTAVSDSFAVKITIYNQGRTQNDSIKVRVIRKMPDGRTVTYNDILAAAPKFSSEVYFWIKSKDIATKGLNRFTVSINPDKKINENGAYANNSMGLDFDMPDNSAAILFPYNNAILGTPVANITAQAASQSSATSLLFELDTSYKFNSAYKQTRTIAGSGIVNTYFNLLTKDTLPYYIRVKPADTAYKVWDTHSFNYIKNSSSGWAQTDYPQFVSGTPGQLYLNDGERNYTFASMSSNTYYFYSVGVNRDPGRNFTARVFRKNNGENMAINGGQVRNGWGFVAIDPKTETPHMPASKYQYFSNLDRLGNPVKTPTPVYLFDSTAFKPQVLLDMKAFIDSIPDGYRVYVLKGENTGYNNYSTQTLQMFVSIGSNLAYLKKIKDEWPLGIKGFKNRPGSASHVTADTNDLSIPPDKQIVILSDQLGVTFTEGGMVSERVGPARQWQTLSSAAEGKDNASDQYAYGVIGVDKDGNEAPLVPFQNIQTDSVDLSSIDATQFPFLKVKSWFRDDSLRTPQKLRYWILNYKGVPEGTVLAKVDKKNLPRDTVTEGDSITFRFPFRNISSFDFDSVLVEVALTDNQNNQTTLFREKTTGIKPGDTLYFKRTFSTKNLSKRCTLTVTFNPGYDQPEQYLNNNIYSSSFYVRRDIQNPYLDVTFDGVRIFDEDLVSASPKIQISATDENKANVIADTSQIEATITFPDGRTEKMCYACGAATFTPADAKTGKATVAYHPEKLSDGMYTLSVQATDGAGNKAGNEPYRVKFNVNNTPSISRFYPYPNPFTTKAAFVFTLTGEAVPQDIHIQIMTMSGTVVRDIYKEELGPLHIGNNTTTFQWDGTDQFGEKLGNGVYLYKVNARLNGQELSLSADQNETFFKRGLGKIVIMR